MTEKMIVVDLDGTLMNERNQITKETIDILQTAAEAGTLIVPATGRCTALIPYELKAVGGIRYAIVANGAGIWDYKAKQFCYRQLMPEGIISMILDNMKQAEGYVEIFANGEAYVDINQMDNLSEDVYDRNFVKYYTQNHVFLTDLRNRNDILEQAEKVNLFYLSPEKKKKLERLIREDGRCAITSSISGNMEIQNKKVNKGSTLKILCDMQNIAPEEVIAFGDSDNDFEMLQFAGTGVAMGNACPRIRQVADDIALTNEENGVAVYLREKL